MTLDRSTTTAQIHDQNNAAAVAERVGGNAKADRHTGNGADADQTETAPTCAHATSGSLEWIADTGNAGGSAA